MVWKNQHKHSANLYRVWFKKNLYSIVVFLFSFFILYSFQYADLSNPLLRSANSYWFSLVDNMTTGTSNYLSLIVKILLVQLALLLSLPVVDKAQWLVHWSLNYALQLIIGTSSDLQKLLKNFNAITIVLFLKVPFTPLASVSQNFLPLCLKDSKSLVFAMSLLNSVASSLE